MTLSPSDPTPPAAADPGSPAGAAGPVAGSASAAGAATADGASTAEATSSEGFLPGTLAELRRVVWPSRQQLFSESVAVILMVGLSAAAIAALDRFLHWVSSTTFPIR